MKKTRYYYNIYAYERDNFSDGKWNNITKKNTNLYSARSWRTDFDMTPLN